MRKKIKKSRATTSSKASEDPKNIFSKAWFKARSEKKNKSKLKQYTTRLNALQNIKNPNDWQKNQLAHAKEQIKRYSPKTIEKAEKTVDKSEKKVNKVEKKVNIAEKKVDSSEKKGEQKVEKKSKYKQVTQEQLDKKIKEMSKPKEKPDPLRKYRRTKGEGIEKKSEGYRGDTRITKHLKKSGWSETRLAKKRKAHAEWKAKRKNRNTLKSKKVGG